MDIKLCSDESSMCFTDPIRGVFFESEEVVISTETDADQLPSECFNQQNEQHNEKFDAFDQDGLSKICESSSTDRRVTPGNKLPCMKDLALLKKFNITRKITIDLRRVDDNQLIGLSNKTKPCTEITNLFKELIHVGQDCNFSDFNKCFKDQKIVNILTCVPSVKKRGRPQGSKNKLIKPHTIIRKASPIFGGSDIVSPRKTNNSLAVVLGDDSHLKLDDFPPNILAANGEDYNIGSDTDNEKIAEKDNNYQPYNIDPNCQDGISINDRGNDKTAKSYSEKGIRRHSTDNTVSENAVYDVVSQGYLRKKLRKRNLSEPSENECCNSSEDVDFCIGRSKFRKISQDSEATYAYGLSPLNVIEEEVATQNENITATINEISDPVTNWDPLLSQSSIENQSFDGKGNTQDLQSCDLSKCLIDNVPYKPAIPTLHIKRLPGKKNFSIPQKWHSSQEALHNLDLIIKYVVDRYPEKDCVTLSEGNCRTDQPNSTNKDDGSIDKSSLNDLVIRDSPWSSYMSSNDFFTKCPATTSNSDPHHNLHPVDVTDETYFSLHSCSNPSVDTGPKMPQTLECTLKSKKSYKSHDDINNNMRLSPKRIPKSNDTYLSSVDKVVESLPLSVSGSEATSVSDNEATSVSGNIASSVSGSEATSVSGNEATSVSGNIASSVSGSEATSVSGSEATSVSVNEATSVSVNEATSVSGSEATSVSGNGATSVSVNEATSVSGNEATSVSGNEATSVSGSEATSVLGKNAIHVSGNELQNRYLQSCKFVASDARNEDVCEKYPTQLVTKSMQQLAIDLSNANGRSHPDITQSRTKPTLPPPPRQHFKDISSKWKSGTVPATRIFDKTLRTTVGLCARCSCEKSQRKTDSEILDLRLNKNTSSTTFQDIPLDLCTHPVRLYEPIDLSFLSRKDIGIQVNILSNNGENLNQITKSEVAIQTYIEQCEQQTQTVITKKMIDHHNSRPAQASSSAITNSNVHVTATNRMPSHTTTTAPSRQRESLKPPNQVTKERIGTPYFVPASQHSASARLYSPQNRLPSPKSGTLVKPERSTQNGKITKPRSFSEAIMGNPSVPRTFAPTQMTSLSTQCQIVESDYCPAYARYPAPIECTKPRGRASRPGRASRTGRAGRAGRAGKVVRKSSSSKTAYNTSSLSPVIESTSPNYFPYPHNTPVHSKAAKQQLGSVRFRSSSPSINMQSKHVKFNPVLHRSQAPVNEFLSNKVPTSRCIAGDSTINQSTVATSTVVASKHTLSSNKTKALPSLFGKVQSGRLDHYTMSNSIPESMCAPLQSHLGLLNTACRIPTSLMNEQYYHSQSIPPQCPRYTLPESLPGRRQLAPGPMPNTAFINRTELTSPNGIPTGSHQVPQTEVASAMMSLDDLIDSVISQPSGFENGNGSYRQYQRTSQEMNNTQKSFNSQ